MRPAPGTWLLLGPAANRRRRSFEVLERVIPDAGGWVPLLVERCPAAGVDGIELLGELACVSVVEPGLALARRSLAERPEPAHTHLRFYSQDYFEAKKRGEITRRYRTTIDGSPSKHTSEAPGEIVEVGPCPGAIESLERCLLPSGPAERTPDGRKLARMRFDNLIDFTIRWDGHGVALDYDRARLRELGAGLKPALEAALGPEAIAEHPGALWYLSKYFTPHPPGEPHFFVKPWAFTVLPPGWSAIVDGVHAADYDVMRGLVHADQFHATPAVFQLVTQLRPIFVAAKTPLLRVTPIPRSKLRAEIELTMLEGVEPQ